MSLYGLRSAPSNWSQLFRNWLVAHGWTRSSYDPCLYTKMVGTHLCMLCHWIDDVLHVGPADTCDAFVNDIDSSKGGTFDITDMGEAQRFMGIEIERTCDQMLLNQQDLIKSLIEKVGLKQSTGARLPMSSKRLTKQDCAFVKNDSGELVHDPSMKKYPFRMVVGVCLWLLHTRPDCAFAVKELSRYCSNYGLAHWNAARRLCDYLLRTQDLKLRFTRKGGLELKCFCDADYNGSADERLSTTAWITYLGDCPWNWCSRSQKFASKSVGEAEYGSLSSATCELLYLRQLLISLDFDQKAVDIMGPAEAEDIMRGAREGPKYPDSTVYSDSTTAIANGKLPVGWLNERLKHCQNHFHVVRQYIAMGWVRLRHVPSLHNPSDALSKPFDSADKWQQLVKLLLGHSDTFSSET